MRAVVEPGIGGGPLRRVRMERYQDAGRRTSLTGPALPGRRLSSTLAYMRVWGESIDDHGTCTVMVAPGSVPVLAKLLDPLAPLVYVNDFAPLDGCGGDHGWTDLHLSLSRDDPTLPTKSWLVTCRSRQ